MKKTKGLWLLFFVVLALVFGGCKSEEKVTAEGLLKEAREKMETTKSVSGNLTMDIGVSYRESGISGSLNLKADIDMEMTTEPQATHMKGSVGLLGMNIEMESYGVEESGKFVTYTCAMGEWTKEESDEIPSADEMKDVLANFKEDDLGLTLADGTEKFEDRDVYVLTGELKGDMVAEMMEASGDALGDTIGDLGDFDYSKLSADMKILIYKDSHYVAQIAMDMKGLDEMADLGADVSFEKCSISISYYTFDDVEKIQVPEAAKSAAASDSMDSLDLFGDIGGSENEDPGSGLGGSLNNGELVQDDQGNYQLEGHYDDITAMVALPEGFALDDENSEPDCLIFDLVQDNYDKQMYVMCTVYLLEPDENFGEDVFSNDHKKKVQKMSADSSHTDVQLSDVQTIQVGDWEVKYTMLSYTYGGSLQTVEYNTWAIQDEDKIVSCDFTEQSFDGECDLVSDMDAVISSLYSGIKIN